MAILGTVKMWPSTAENGHDGNCVKQIKSIEFMSFRTFVAAKGASTKRVRVFFFHNEKHMVSTSVV